LFNLALFVSSLAQPLWKSGLAALEAAVQGQKSLPESVFDAEFTDMTFSGEVEA